MQMPFRSIGFQDFIDFDEKVLLEGLKSTAREQSSWLCWILKAHFLLDTEKCVGIEFQFFIWI